MKVVGIISFFVISIFLFIPVFADDFVIIPESGGSTTITGVDKAEAAVNAVSTASAGKLWDEYNKKADSMRGDLGSQMASGIMNWDTLLNYVIYLVKFLSQLAMVIGAATFIYAGYIYGTSIFTGNASQGSKAIKHAIIGIIIVIFSYAIMKILTSMFLS